MTNERRQQYDAALDAYDRAFAALQQTSASARAIGVSHEDAIRGLYGVLDGLMEASKAMQTLFSAQGTAMDAALEANRAVLALLRSEP